MEVQLYIMLFNKTQQGILHIFEYLLDIHTPHHSRFVVDIVHHQELCEHIIHTAGCMLYFIEKTVDEGVFAFKLADTDKPHKRGNRPSKVVRGTISKQVQLLVGNFELLVGHNQAFGTLSYDFLKFGIEAL